MMMEIIELTGYCLVLVNRTISFIVMNMSLNIKIYFVVVEYVFKEGS